jgi:hypothetical protein
LGVFSISWYFFDGEAFHDILEFDSFLSSSDEEMFERTCKQHQIVFVASMVGTNT